MVITDCISNNTYYTDAAKSWLLMGPKILKVKIHKIKTSNYEFQKPKMNNHKDRESSILTQNKKFQQQIAA